MTPLDVQLDPSASRGRSVHPSVIYVDDLTPHPAEIFWIRAWTRPRSDCLIMSSRYNFLFCLYILSPLSALLYLAVPKQRVRFLLDDMPGSRNSLKHFLVINTLHRASRNNWTRYFADGRTDLAREAIGPSGSNCYSMGGAYQCF